MNTTLTIGHIASATTRTVADCGVGKLERGAGASKLADSLIIASIW